MRLVFRILIVVAAVAGLAALALALIFLEDQPRVAQLPPPQPEDVAAVREFVIAVRQATKPDGGEGPRMVSIPIADLPSIMRLGVRFFPGLRTAASVEHGAVKVAASLAVPWPGAQRWLNVRATVPPFDGHFGFGMFAVGDRLLPPGLTLSAGTIGANLVFGKGIGD